MTRGLAAIVLPALFVVAAPAEAATRHVWVAAVPQTWNAVPNARDAIHGTQFAAGETTFPTVVYRRYTKGWKRPVRLPYEGAAGVGRIPGPLIRARVGDELRIHFKNLDTLHDQPHSMHFHGVEYEPVLRRRVAAAVLGQGRQRQARPDFTYELTAGHGSAGVWPYHDHSVVDGGLDRRRHVRRALDRAARRAPGRPRVRRRVRAVARLPDDQRARVRRQHAGFDVARRRARSSGTSSRSATSSTPSTSTGTSWRTETGVSRRTRAGSDPQSRSACAGGRTRRAPGSTTATSSRTCAQGMIGLYKVRP